ncbi:LysM peptidoglycan-binding domain-containing protein [Bacteriovoracaceae bacterium]|nr:LysM peptidoglycan-binding domain-containing protein [Bacteriovoracaceae bacterium]
MKLSKILFFALLLALVSCSNNKKKADAEVSESESISQDADFIVDADSEELLIDEPSSEDPMLLAEEPVMSNDAEMVSSSPEVTIGEEIGEYTVARGETLMMVSFKVYGDYRNWKEIRSFNGLSSNMVAEGTVVRYKKPTQEFVWNPEGLPYLIKSGDTLVTISKDKYGTASKWNYIYDNNKPLIRDPNLIFAGFTLYYIPEDREIASEF